MKPLIEKKGALLLLAQGYSTSCQILIGLDYQHPFNELILFIFLYNFLVKIILVILVLILIDMATITLISLVVLRFKGVRNFNVVKCFTFNLIIWVLLSFFN